MLGGRNKRVDILRTAVFLLCSLPLLALVEKERAGENAYHAQDTHNDTGSDSGRVRAAAIFVGFLFWLRGHPNGFPGLGSQSF